MAERINLAQFDIDTRLLEEKIARNQTAIDLLKGEIRDTRKAAKEYQDQAKLVAGVISQLTEQQNEANEEFAQGRITQERYNEIIAESSRLIRDNEVQLGNLLESEREQQRQLVRYQNDLRGLNQENRELNTLLRGGQTELEGSEGSYRDLSTQLSRARTEANNLGAQMRQLERDGQQNSEEYQNVSRRWQEASENARNLHNELLTLDRATGDNRRNVGNYADSIKEAFSEIGVGIGQITSGNVTQGFATLSGSISGVTASLRALSVAILTNPLTALAAVISGITVGLYQGIKAVFEYNAEISKLNKEVEGLTNLTGVTVDRIREYAISLQDVFGRDFQDSVREINSLIKDFGLTSEQAFDLYSEGLTKGGAFNSEFGDSIREYGPLFAQNGYSAQEFLNLLNAGIDLDIYTDKLPDAIKEAGLALNEQTKATRDALINAFGESFSDDLLARVRNGSATIKQAVDEIAAQAQKVGLNTQQIAQLNADVFKGAGEDAGGLLVLMEAFTIASDKNAQSLTESQKATINVIEATVELEKAKTKALKSDDVIALQKNMELLSLKIQIGFYKVVEALGEGVKWFDRVTGTSKLLSKAWDEVEKFGKSLYDSVRTLYVEFKNLYDSLGLNNSAMGSFMKILLQILNPINVIRGAIIVANNAVRVFSGTIQATSLLISTFAITAKNLFSQVISIATSVKNLDFSGALEKLKNISISDELKKAREEAVKIAAINNKQKQEPKEEVVKNSESIIGNDKLTGAVSDAAAKAEKERQKLLAKQLKEQDKAVNDAKKKQEEAVKQDLANAKEKANIAIQMTQAELSEYIAMNAEKLKSDKRLTQARVNELKAYYENVREQQQIANEKEKQLKLQSLDEQINAIKGVNQQELDQKSNLVAQKAVIEKEYATKEIEINTEANDNRQKVDEKFLEEKTERENLTRALEFEKKLLDLEQQGASEFEIQKTQLDQQTEQKLASFLAENDLKRELDQENYDTNAEIEAQRRELENQIALEQDEVKKQNLQNLLAALNVIRTDYANKDLQIAEAKEKARFDLAKGIAGNMIAIAGQETLAGKAFAIAQTTIDTYQSAVSAYKSLSGIPVVGPALGAVAAGLAVASGLANVAKISGINLPNGLAAGLSGLSSSTVSVGKLTAPSKAADGMLIGASHANGGIPIKTPDGMIEAEGGEIIINKKSSAMYRDVLSQINQIGGGVKFATGGIVGGVNVSRLPTVQNSIKNGIDLNIMSDMISSAVLEGSMMGTQMGSQQGIVGLSENRQIQQGANF